MDSKRGSSRTHWSGRIESWWPFIVAGITTALYLFFGNNAFPQPAENLLAASCGVAAVLVGFLATAKAIVLSITGTRVYRVLREANYTGLFLDYTLEAITGAMVFMIYSIVGFFISDPNAGLPFWYRPGWMLLGVLSLGLFWRFTSILFKLLRHVGG